ncbi:hypothetical protein LINPERPRIM_LOCUS1573 [Linum perenne]
MVLDSVPDHLFSLIASLRMTLWCSTKPPFLR